jgi:hypothetical protein
MERNTVGRRTIKRGASRPVVDGKGFRLADEIGYIQDILQPDWPGTETPT